MTVNTISSIAEFDTNGVTTNYPFFFKFLANEDLVVTYVDPLGVSSILTFGTHYTVNGAGSENGGSIVTTAALAGPGQLIVSREMQAFQQTSLRNQGKFLAETHEDVFDKLTMLVQQGFAIFKRALTRPFGRDYFFAENRRITAVKDPVDAQDAATKLWAQTYVGAVVEGMTGNPNLASNVFYLGPDGVPRVVQDMSGPNGAQLIGGVSATLQSLAQLSTALQDSARSYFVISHSAGTGKGGGTFVWNGARARSKHNGGTIISPTVPPYTGESGLSNFLAGVGETAPSAFGCFERVIKNNTLSIYDFGAVSSYANCTAPIQKALAETRSNNGYGSNIGVAVIFPPEQFMFGGSITIGSTQNIVMYPKTILQQIAGTMVGVNAALLSCSGQTDVSIYAPGATLKGVKYEATTGEGRAAVSIYASARVSIYGLRCLTVSGDGFTISGNASDGSDPSSDVTLTECFTDSAGRNGFSIINARRCALVRCGATYTAENGLGASAGGPWAGFDIENDQDSTHVLEGISLTDCWSKNNAGNGLQFTLPYSSSPMSVHVTNFRSEQDGSGTQYGALCGGVGFIYGGGSTLSGNNYGSITLKNITIVKPFGSGIRFRNWSAKNAPVLIDGVTIDQPSYGGGTGNINRCGLWADASDAGNVAENKGNFEVRNLVVNNPPGDFVRAVWAVGVAGAPMIASIRDVFLDRHSADGTALVRARVLGGVSFTDKKFATFNNAGALSAYEYLGREVSLSGTGGALLPAAALCAGCTITLRNTNAANITVTTEGGNFTTSTFATYTNSGTVLTLTPGQRAVLTSDGAAWVLE